MKLTTRGRYAVTAMLDLAVHEGDGPITLLDVSERQGISLSYLEQLFTRLRRSQLVSSSRGPGGGYVLGRSSADICLAEIVDSVDETMDATRCGGRGDCQSGKQCLTHELWSDLGSQIRSYLSGISLASMVQKRTVREVAARQNSTRAARVPARQLGG